MNSPERDKIRRARIKFWLEVQGMSRKDLADKLSVTESALNGWLSNKPLPPARWEEISALFSEPERPKRDRFIVIPCTEEEENMVKRLAQGLPIGDGLREVLLRQAKGDLSE